MNTGLPGHKALNQDQRMPCKLGRHVAAGFARASSVAVWQERSVRNLRFDVVFALVSSQRKC